MVSISQPRGQVPRTRGCNLPANFAERAENINLSSGRFEPWRQSVEFVRFDRPVVKAHHRDGCWTATHRHDVTYVDAGVACKKTYGSCPGERPIVTNSLCCEDWTYLGYPVPDTPVAFPDPCEDLEKRPDTEQVTYRITYENDCGEEGPASCPTDAVAANKDSRIGLMFPEPPDCKWGVNFVNIYRSRSLWDPETRVTNRGENTFAGWASADTEQDWFLVAQVPVSTRNYVDEGTEAVGRLLVTDDMLPPREGAIVAGETESGSMVLWHERSIWFSKRNQYWGFPLKTAHDFPACITDVCVCRDDVYVLTTEGAFHVSDAVDCAASSCRPVRELKESPASLTPRSCAGFQGGVFYSSPEGLALATAEGSVRIVSSRAFAKDDWNLLGPIRGLTIACGHLLIHTDRETLVWQMAFDESGLLPADVTTLSFNPDSWMAGEQDQLYYVLDNRVYLFNAGAEYMQMDWLQAEQRTLDRTRVSAIHAEYVKKDGINTNLFQIYRNGRLSAQKKLTEGSRRIRSTAATCTQVRIKGTEPMCGMAYGTGLTDLRGETA